MAQQLPKGNLLVLVPLWSLGSLVFSILYTSIVVYIVGLDRTSLSKKIYLDSHTYELFQCAIPQTSAGQKALPEAPWPTFVAARG